MRFFDYKEKPKTLLTPEIVGLVSNIREMKGRQEFFTEVESDTLTSLNEIAKIQSTRSSNRIEGIKTADNRLKKIVENKLEPKSRSENEIAGYRDVLATIHENYKYIPINSNIILQFHRDLYGFSNAGFAGVYKDTDNFIAEIDSDGKEVIRFKPVSAIETEPSIEQLCSAFNQAIRERNHEPLILISMFVLDFLCIHPFHDGNGRISRLLTLLLLYQSDFFVGKYISLEMLIEKSKETYYEALQESSSGWHKGNNNYEHFTIYLLGVVFKAYVEFEKRVEDVRSKKLTKAERVEAIIYKSIEPISKKEILEFAPDISQITVERALKNLQDQNKIKKIGKGRSTQYIKK